jgi:shikimate kinase
MRMDGPNIVLTGFMATGKTTIGKLIARHLGYKFIDTDELIVQRAGMSVAGIFQKKGEPVFRKMESDLAAELSKKQGLVISTGGGMMMDQANASVLSATGQVFCLAATPEEIFDRVSKDTDVKRPLLDAPDPLQEIIKLLKQRESGYRKFTQIDTSGKSPDQTALQIIDMIKENPDF